jgi:hypothetical protein
MIGDAVKVNEIQTKNFEILNSPDSTIVSVVPPAVEEVVAAPAEGEAAVEGATEPAEPEVISKGKKDEEEEGK